MKINLANILQNKYIICIDIGASSVKLAHFKKNKEGLLLIKAGCRNFGFRGGKNLRGQEIISILKDFFKEINLEKNDFVLTVNSPKTAVKIISAVCSSKKELGEILKADLQNYFPFSLSEPLVDFEILQGSSIGNNLKYKVLLATSTQKTIYEILILLQKFGIKYANFIPSSYALLKLAGKFTREDKNICFLDLGGAFTEALFFKGKNLISSYKIFPAGKSFTKALSGLIDSNREQIELTQEEAEVIKKQIGIPLQEEQKIIDNKISTTQVLNSFEPLLDKLINEIRSCLDNFSDSEKAKIDKFYLSGGGVYFKNLAKLISKRLRREVEYLDPFTVIKVKEDVRLRNQQNSAIFATIIGAALGGLRGINLAPTEVKEKAKKNLKIRITAVFSTLAFLLIVFFYFGLQGYGGYLQRKITIAKTKLVASHAKIKKNNSLFLINRILAKQPYWEDIFRELSNIVPESIYFEELNFKNNILEIKGAISGQRKKETLTEFIKVLEKGVFKSIDSVAYSGVEEEAFNKFTLQCRVN